MAASNQPGGQSSDVVAPKLSSPNSPLRKLSYESGFFVRLGQFAEDAGLNKGDNVVPNLTEDGSILLLEDPHGNADDSRSIKGHSRRVNIPPAMIRAFGVHQDEYDPKGDPVVCYIDPYPDETGYPSAVEVFPLGFENEVLDSDGRLLAPNNPPDTTSGKPWVTEGETTKTETGRRITSIGIGTNIVEIALDQSPVDDEGLWQTLREVANLRETHRDLLETDGAPHDVDQQRIYPMSEATWAAIGENLEMDQEILEVVKFIHEREAKMALARCSDAPSAEEYGGSVPLVGPV